jgi:DNA modification methylase
MDEWQDCYNLGWNKIIVKEAFSHPAKFSRGLILRIYDHAKEMGWIKPGDIVIDPFGGVALGAFYAGKFNLIWIGVELEKKFVKLGEENIELWGLQGTARIVQGDSRRLWEALNCQCRNEWDEDPACICGSGVKHCPKHCDIEKADLVVSSPPYEGSMNSTDTEFIKKHLDDTGRDYRKPGHQSLIGKFGSSNGQLGNMKEGDIDLCVSSPPYAESFDKYGKGDKTEQGIQRPPSYGDTPGQLASMYYFEHGRSRGIKGESGDTFWSASKEIVQGCYDLLKPGGRAIWVCKDYIKNKKRVPFSDRWQTLCESVGFRLVCRHKAMLIKESKGFFHTDKKERKSFFRRLAESKGSPPIDWEDIICMEKPENYKNDAGIDLVVSSPPFTTQFPAHDKQENYKGFEKIGSVKNQQTGYRYADNTEGNLASMKEGDIDLVLTNKKDDKEDL